MKQKKQEREKPADKKEDKESRELRKKIEDYAEESGFKLNPEDKITSFIIKGLLKNKKEKGELYCPCRRVSGNRQEDIKIICPCIYHISEIKEQGHCHCNLFFK